WRTERWDSLRLLSPNWMSRLPGWSYAGPDPHGFMTADEVVTYLGGYATASDAPVVEDSAVLHLGRGDNDFVVTTTDQTWQAARVVMATGWCDQPAVPAFAAALDPAIAQVVPSHYRNPRELPDGGVLIVGASATGVQLADELAAAGRPVVLAVGRHSRLPRRYRGMDIFWWLERIGSLDRTIDEMPDPAAARREPSLQLVGRPDHADLDLATLQANGVELAGRLLAVEGTAVRFAGDLPSTVAAVDERRRQLLAAIDAHIDASGLAAEVLDPVPPLPVAAGGAPDRLDLRARGITTVIWATGHRRTYPWLALPVLDAAGEIRHRHGVTPVPGLYVLGQRFQHRRRSSFIDGVGRDAVDIADHLTGHFSSVPDPARSTCT
ncbi:MAG TPA: NAD(P)-binding domain-containing protein, partial [Acidimicrobiales bacterium]